jgi:uncharacterized protein (DUF885 family)
MWKILRQFAILTLVVPGLACPGATSDTEFNRLAADFLAGYLAWRPQAGTALGLHEYDGQVTDVSPASTGAELARLRDVRDRVNRFDPQNLSAGAAYDWQILRAAIERELFQFEVLEPFTRNPMTYLGAADVSLYVKRDFAPLEDRARSVVRILDQVPRVLSLARTNLAEVLPRPFVETALEIADGTVGFLTRDLVEALKALQDPALKSTFEAANRRAVEALRQYSAWLRRERLPSAKARYALGRPAYQRLLAGELIDLAPEKVLDLGLEALRREQRIFAETAARIDPGRRPLDVFKAIQREHPTPESLVSDTKRDLEAIRQFVVERRIVTLPTEVRARVEETPRHLRATSFASMDTPGPFETRATEAYYYVTPVEPEWTAQQKDEWLTAFNYYTTDIVSIHEAYPGHYAQFLCLNASSASRLEKVFGSYAFTEGWAHYTEQMMLEEGFGSAGFGPDPKPDALRAAKYRLAQSDEALLRLCRLCVSIKMHCEDLSLEAATRFFEENCYYEHKPAHQEALRGTYDPGYLFYSVGKLQMLKLRRDYQQQEGARFTLERFHDEVLRHGMPPVRLLRELLLKDPRTWDQTL